MDFLDRFGERERDRLLAAASTLRLGRGELLLRRGDRGGDIFRVAEGELEVIDTRSQPAVVLDVFGKGQVVGEMAFLDESRRSADVRAADGAVCQRWERASLLRILEKEPTLAASFYRVVAELIAERARNTVSNAMTGSLTSHGPRRPGNESAVAEGQALAEGLRTQLMQVEPLLRRDRQAGRQQLLTTLHNFNVSMTDTLARMSEEDALDAGKVLARELHPYLMRSHLGELALDRPAGHVGDALAVAHVMTGRPEGDGALGEILDEWMLSLPTARAFRERRAQTAELVVEALPTDSPVRGLVINAGSGALVAELIGLLARVRGELTVVDGSRENLAFVDAGLPGRPRDLKLKLVVDDLASLCLGRSRMKFAPQHFVVIDSLLEYLPERCAVALLRWAAGLVAPGGALVVGALAPADDDAVFRHLLGWPLVRRGKSALAGLLAGVGLDEVRAYDAGSAGIVATGRTPARARDAAPPLKAVR
ncbi:MAG: cyclic nucleotide-binding domain-containing protein [Myxococcota bacterium]